jgi:hypothetical protein
MKLAAISLMFVFAPMGVGWIDGPPPTRTHYSWKSLGEDLAHLRASIHKVEHLIHPDCRDLSPEKTVRCAADLFGVSEEQAVSVWSCESGFGTESPHTDAYHGPFQYLYSTYQSQQESMPDVVEWHELSPAVHDMRSNVMTAIAYAARNGWGPWSCA